MRLLLSLLLVGCSLNVTPENVADAERMCERQKGYASINVMRRWLTVECNNGMVFKKRLK